MLHEKMNVSINGKTHEIPATFTVKQLLQMLDLEQPRIAVAVNSEVVPRAAFGQRQLADGDRIEILHAVGGG